MKKEDITVKDKSKREENHSKQNPSQKTNKSTENEASNASANEVEDNSQASDDDVNPKDVDINDIKEEISVEEQLKQDVEFHKDRYLRLFAEFENYKRRTSKERLELFKTASQKLMQDMLPVLDDFDRAMREIKKYEDDSIIEGVELINNKLSETLKSNGLESMAVKAGDTFDADLHEAVTQIPAPDQSMKGKIVDVVEKGYTLGEKIIRFPKVVTGK